MSASTSGRLRGASATRAHIPNARASPPASGALAHRPPQWPLPKQTLGRRNDQVGPPGRGPQVPQDRCAKWSCSTAREHTTAQPGSRQAQVTESLNRIRRAFFLSLARFSGQVSAVGARVRSARMSKLSVGACLISGTEAGRIGTASGVRTATHASGSGGGPPRAGLIATTGRTSTRRCRTCGGPVHRRESEQETVRFNNTPEYG